MEHEVNYQKRVGVGRLEIAGAFGRYLGSVHYQAQDRRFQDGGLDLVLGVLLTMAEELSNKERLTHLFFGPFDPILAESSKAPEEAKAMFAELQRQLKTWTVVQLGEREQLSGWIFPAWEAIALLRKLIPGMRGISADDSMLRLVLLQGPASDAQGWDFQHANGSTHLGRWTQNVEQRPGSVDVQELPLLRVALEAGRVLLERVSGPA